MASRIDFACPHGFGAVQAVALDAPPGFALSSPDAGWIYLTVQHGDSNFDRVAMSDVFPPLMQLWAWSLAVAWGLMPVTLRIDEEGSAVYMTAETVVQERLRFTLTRTTYGWDTEPEPVLQALTWHEDRTAFLQSWGRLWAAYLHDDTMPWHEWLRTEEQLCPEPARDMPWDALASIPAVEAGARQGSCRLVHAANGCLTVAGTAPARRVVSRSGLSATTSMFDQSRV